MKDLSDSKLISKRVVVELKKHDNCDFGEALGGQDSWGPIHEDTRIPTRSDSPTGMSLMEGTRALQGRYQHPSL